MSDLDLVIGAAAINSGMSESVPELVDTVSLDCDIETEEKMRTAHLKVDTLTVADLGPIHFLRTLTCSQGGGLSFGTQDKLEIPIYSSVLNILPEF